MANIAEQVGGIAAPQSINQLKQNAAGREVHTSGEALLTMQYMILDHMSWHAEQDTAPFFDCDGCDALILEVTRNKCAIDSDARHDLLMSMIDDLQKRREARNDTKPEAS